MNKVVKLFLLTLILVGSYSCRAQQLIDSLFVSWNTKTINSLERQVKAQDNNGRRSEYENRLSVIFGYLDIKNAESVNKKSIRYEFLKEIFQNSALLKASHFYVIESNENGSKVLLRTFVVWEDTLHKTRVEYYVRGSEKWQKLGECSLDKFFIENKLSNYLETPWKGFNNDDIIITEFRNGIVKASEYFLFGTLSSKSRVNELLDCYNKEVRIRIKI